MRPLHSNQVILSMNPLPRVRTGLLRHTLEAQALVYDSGDNRIHLLDPVTACVLELLEEGGWTSEGISAEIAVRMGFAPNEGFLPLALEELRKAELLETGAEAPTPISDVTRRGLLRKLAVAGAAAVLIPAIATLTSTPGYAQGTNTVQRCGACTTTAQCTGSRICSNNGVCSPTNPGRAIGQNCGQDAQCCSNNCVAGLVCGT